MYKICFVVLAIAVIYAAAVPYQQDLCNSQCVRDCKLQGYYKAGYCPDGQNCVCREPQGIKVDYADNTCYTNCGFDCKQALHNGGYCTNTATCFCIPRY